MNRLTEEEREGLSQLEDGVDGYNEIKSVTFNELHVGVFYHEENDSLVVDVYEIDEVTDRYTDCTSREALEIVMAILDEAWNG